MRKGNAFSRPSPLGLGGGGVPHDHYGPVHTPSLGDIRALPPSTLFKLVRLGTPRPGHAPSRPVKTCSLEDPPGPTPICTPYIYQQAGVSCSLNTLTQILKITSFPFQSCEFFEEKSVFWSFHWQVMSAT